MDPYFIFWLLILVGALHILADLYVKPRFHRHVAVRLNLRLHGHRHMAQVGDHFLATINPTDASGNPAPVTNVIWSTQGSGYSAVGAGNQASLVASQVSAGNTVTVTADASDGSHLSQVVALEDVAAPAVPVAVALNLTVVAAPIAPPSNGATAPA